VSLVCFFAGIVFRALILVCALFFGRLPSLWRFGLEVFLGGGELRSCVCVFWLGDKMPEMVASYSSQRFSALLDFQRDVDLVYPSHLGKKSPSVMDEGFLLSNANAKANHHRGRHGDTHWQESWSDSLSTLLMSSFQRAPSSSSRSPVAASPARPCAVEAARRSSSSSFTTRTALTRSQGQFSPQKFIRNALKRAFARDAAPSSSSVMVKRARFEDFGSTAEPMVCG